MKQCYVPSGTLDIIYAGIKFGFNSHIFNLLWWILEF